jgi:4-amino-4-deoxy-L-arabinose transferase-like glycosyltransferase
MGRYVLIGLTLIAAGVLLFARLGHNALWDDEAGTALTAKGVLRTGDTSVLLDDGNINAYRNGLDVRSFCDRSMPPLDAYLTAASFAIFGIDAWAARLPFALIGLATIGLVLFWARRESWPLLLILGLGLISNVSLILFLHQCRYYAPSVFFSTKPFRFRRCVDTPLSHQLPRVRGPVSMHGR